MSTTKNVKQYFFGNRRDKSSVVKNKIKQKLIKQKKNQK